MVEDCWPEEGNVCLVEDCWPKEGNVCLVEDCWPEEGQEGHPSQGDMGEVDLKVEACQRCVDVVLEPRSDGSQMVESLSGPLAGGQMDGWVDSVEEVEHS